jgi:predicted O-linked N-acetylglucosamine transferase (SPINDLY family)
LAIALQHQQDGRLHDAERIYRQILAVDPDQPYALHLLGTIAHQAGNLEEAVACWQRALQVNPDFAATHSNLGVAFKEQGKLVAAVACYRRALELNPEYAEAHNNLGVALREQGKLDEAVACCRRAVELKPDYAEAHNNLSVALREQGKLDEAAACGRRAVELRPDYAVAHNNLGSALQERGELDEAAACWRRAVELNPDYAEAHNNLGNALKDLGQAEEAAACYRCALELKPDYTVAHSNWLFSLHYRAGITPLDLAEAHAEFDRRHAAPLRSEEQRAASAMHGSLLPAPRPAARVPRPLDRRLRLGFVSPDLGRHPVGYFLVRVLENLGREGQETICYSDRLQSAASCWRDTVALSDQPLAEQIRIDRIDVLFDLAGHTAHNRLLVFARKPAPIQVTWAGYVGTTGLTAIDYLLADRFEVPAGAERHYRERVLRMPDGYVCYDPPAYAPPVTPLPALDGGQATFACFNNPAKITPRAIDVWAAILCRLPGARLVLKFKGWNDRGVARRCADLFAARGIDPGRLEFLGSSPHEELLAEYRRVDLALDPFPYSGGLTTCEALWMGVPVITCPGETFASRHSLSHLSNVGLTETIAGDLDQYVERAVSLASDLPRLAALRAGLRERMAASPHCDGRRFAAALVSILRGVWEQQAE